MKNIHEREKIDIYKIKMQFSGKVLLYLYVTDKYKSSFIAIIIL